MEAELAAIISAGPDALASVSDPAETARLIVAAFRAGYAKRHIVLKLLAQLCAGSVTPGEPRARGAERLLTHPWPVRVHVVRLHQLRGDGPQLLRRRQLNHAL